MRSFANGNGPGGHGNSESGPSSGLAGPYSITINGTPLNGVPPVYEDAVPFRGAIST
jgi:hypothetical protein